MIVDPVNPSIWVLLELCKNNRQLWEAFKKRNIVAAKGEPINVANFSSINNVLAQGEENGVEPSKSIDRSMWNSLPKDVRKILSEQGYYCADEAGCQFLKLVDSILDIN